MLEWFKTLLAWGGETRAPTASAAPPQHSWPFSDRLALARREHEAVGGVNDALRTNTDFVETEQGDLLCLATRGTFSQTLSDKLAYSAPPATEPCATTLARLGRLVTQPEFSSSWLPCKLYESVDTSAERLVNGHLGKLAGLLVGGKFDGTNTGHSCAIIGPRGCGKTIALRRFAVVAQVVFSKLRVVYVDARHCQSPAHPLTLHGGLAGLLAHLFLDNGGGGEQQQTLATTTTMGRVIDALKTRGEFLMLLVDEMEALYENNSPAIRAVLDDVEALALSTRGRTSFVGCSSSSLLYPLIKGGGDLGAYKPVFRMLHSKAGLPHLNGDKLTPTFVCVDAPTDTTVSAGFVQAASSPHSNAAADALMVAFAYGSSTRAMFNPAVSASVIKPTDQLVNASSPFPDYVRSFLTVHANAPRVCDAVYDALCTRNLVLLRGLLRPNAAQHKGSLLDVVDADVVREGAWARDFQPLTHTEFSELVRTAVGRELPNRIAANMITIQDFLAFDTALIILKYHHPQDRTSFDVYPKSMLALLAHGFDRVRRQ